MSGSPLKKNCVNAPLALAAVLGLLGILIVVDRPTGELPCSTTVVHPLIVVDSCDSARSWERLSRAVAEAEMKHRW
jgi:hypothetical protein